MTVLITGATGTVGRLLVGDLLERGADVRAVSRTPATAGLPDGVDVVGGDLAGVDAFDGIDTVFLFPADRGADRFVERAVAAGVERFVVLSSLAVSGRNERDRRSASALHHRAVEEAVTSRTDGWTILRPGNFATNLLSWAYPIRSGFPVRVPHPTSSQVLLHEADLARAAAIAVTGPDRSGEVIELTGPQTLTRADQLAAISAAIGREVPFVEVGPEDFRADVSAFIGDDIVDMLLAYWSDTVAAPEQPLPAPLGLTMTPFAQWAHDHMADFGG